MPYPDPSLRPAAHTRHAPEPRRMSAAAMSTNSFQNPDPTPVERQQCDGQQTSTPAQRLPSRPLGPSDTPHCAPPHDWSQRRLSYTLEHQVMQRRTPPHTLIREHPIHTAQQRCSCLSFQTGIGRERPASVRPSEYGQGSPSLAGPRHKLTRLPPTIGLLRALQMAKLPRLLGLQSSPRPGPTKSETAANEFTRLSQFSSSVLPRVLVAHSAAVVAVVVSCTASP